MEKPEVGDIIERVMMPCELTLRGSHKHPWGPTWFFRLWRAEVVEIKTICPKEIIYDIKEPEILMPDDLRVVRFLIKNFTPTEIDLKVCKNEIYI